jgi:hypothetical protein
MSDVGRDRLRNTQGFLAKNVKEIFWDLKFLSEVTGCRKIQVSDHTGSTVFSLIFSYFVFYPESSLEMTTTEFSFIETSLEIFFLQIIKYI